MSDSGRRILVVGGGAIAKRGHLPAIRELQGAQIAGLVDPDRDAARRTSAEFGIADVFSTLEDALARVDVDIVDVCAPTPAHYDAILEAFGHGKAILVEKPLVTRGEEIVRITELLDATNGSPKPLVSVVQNFRYARVVRKARERLAGGYLGSLVSITCFAASRFPISWTRSRWLYENGGVLLDFAPHAVDLLVLFAGAPPARVTAFGGDFTRGQMGFPNYAQIGIEFENGVVAQLDSSWLTGTVMLTLGLHGTGGHINIDARNEYYQEYHGTYTPFDDFRDFRSRVGSTLRRLKSGEFFRGPMGIFRDLISDFIEAHENRTPAPVTIGEGLATSVILAAAEESLRARRPVDCAEWLGTGTMSRIADWFPTRES